MTRRTFLAGILAGLSYTLVAVGVSKPVFRVRRFLKCGNEVKLLFSQASFNPTMEACWINGSIARGFGPLAGMLCKGFRASRQKDGSWRGDISYRSCDGNAIHLGGHVFQIYEWKWHSHLYGPLPAAEVVTPEVLESA